MSRQAERGAVYSNPIGPRPFENLKSADPLHRENAHRRITWHTLSADAPEPRRGLWASISLR